MDGYIKKDLSLFERDKIEQWKSSQSRDEFVSLLKELDETQYRDYQKVFRNWNRAYANQYETIFNMYLIKPAQKISSRRISTKTRVLNTLKSYREEKHSELFSSLIPQIRNSIQHQDFIIDPKQPKITFYDKRKPPLTLTIKEYSKIFWESFFLVLAFDIACFDLTSNLIEIILESIDILNDYLKKHGKKLVEDKFGLSILDLALLIKSGKIRE